MIHEGQLSDDGLPLENCVEIGAVLGADDEVLLYVYDFGDGWEFRLDVVGRVPSGPDDQVVTMVEHVGPGLVEDSGGPGAVQQIPDRAASAVDVSKVEQHLHGMTIYPAHVGFPRPLSIHPALEALAANHPGLHPLFIADHMDVAAASWRPITDDHAAKVVSVFRTYLDVIGEGAPLTSAGYLKPSIVVHIEETLGIRDEWWPSKKEVDSHALLTTREVLQQSRLIRKDKGRLVLTKKARTVTDHALLGELRNVCLPKDPSSFEYLATMLAVLLAAAGWPQGYSQRGVHVAAQMNATGWSTSEGDIRPFEIWRDIRGFDRVTSLMLAPKGEPTATQLGDRVPIIASWAAGLLFVRED